jgi:hypothetical protein
MNNFHKCLVIGAAALALASPALATEYIFTESITDSLTHRTTHETGGLLHWEETKAGNPLFGTSVDRITYMHSVDGIEPPVIPNGTVLQMRLKIFLKAPGDKEFELTVDSMELSKIHRRHFLIGADPADTLTIEGTPLGNGTLEVHVESRSGKELVARRSILDLTYREAVPTGVGDGQSYEPRNFSLRGNFPNPFNPTTAILYTLQRTSDVRIDIFNIQGQRVTSMQLPAQNAGFHTVTWDGTDRMRQKVGSGVYFYRVRVGDEAEVRKMVLLK